jgi:ribosomal protein S18 acetylase RimI-like enzyme
MAVLETLRSFFVPEVYVEPEVIVPAPPCEYDIQPLTRDQLPEVLRLNIRCFRNGDNYTKHTFRLPPQQPRTLELSYRYRARRDGGFAFVMVNESNAAHLTTIGVAPEHRRRGIAERLLRHIEDALYSREVGTLVLEVRVSNTAAHQLYRRAGYTIVQRITKYYNNGETAF